MTSAPVIWSFLSLLPAPAALPADVRAGDMLVSEAWSRPTPPAATVGVVYLTMTNLGSATDRLLEVHSPAARAAEIHESRMTQGNMTMQPLAAVEVPPKATVRIAPGGVHIMLIGLKQPLSPGMEITVELHFERAGVLTLPVRVRNAD